MGPFLDVGCDVYIHTHTHTYIYIYISIRASYTFSFTASVLLCFSDCDTNGERAEVVTCLTRNFIFLGEFLLQGCQSAYWEVIISHFDCLLESTNGSPTVIVFIILIFIDCITFNVEKNQLYCLTLLTFEFS